MDNNLPSYRTPEDARLAAEAEKKSTIVEWAYGWLSTRETDVLSNLPAGLGEVCFDKSLCGRGYRLRRVRPEHHERLLAYLNSVRPGRNARSYPEVHEVAWDRLTPTKCKVPPPRGKVGSRWTRPTRSSPGTPTTPAPPGSTWWRRRATRWSSWSATS